MDYVNPTELVSEALATAKRKASLSIPDLLIRGILAGAFLGYATSFAMIILSQGLPPIVSALCFPAGFVMLVLLGMELATGNFALLPPGVITREIRFSALLRNWCWVYVGNLLGSILYAGLFYLAITNLATSDPESIGMLFKQAAQKKTLLYMGLGAHGWAAAFVKDVLCNWMVTVGALLALVSRSTIGKIAAMWLPITIFFAHGYEHSIVNMFVIPEGMLLGAPVSLHAWWLWNQIPVTLGNILAGTLCTGLAFYFT